MSALTVLDPRSNAVVDAAAGTGKTWLLTSRIIRLLLAGVAPGSILAITFTRTAAADIHERLRGRLLDFASADDARLDSLLREIGATDPVERARARGLYEQLLTATQPLRATTFHAFCQSLLRRFALEAGVPPAFDLLENTVELESSAWHAFDAELTRSPTDPLAQAMDTLLQATGNTGTARDALSDFLNHRSDWWAYTETATDPVAFAVDALRRQLNVSDVTDPIAAVATDIALRADALRYATLLARHATTTNIRVAAAITEAYGDSIRSARRYVDLRRAFYTSEGMPRVLKSGGPLTKALGAAGVDELLQLHGNIIARLDDAHATNLRARTFQISRAWYVCGQRLNEHYQQLKRERGMLDFADLEWHTYQLLHHAEHAEWVQYKLDQRIDHLLVDEFQDTNPTQWRLLAPLLNEIAAGGDARPRSAFLVGDENQSIYRFRRAEPRLFQVARDWLTRHARARTHTQHISWRSSPAIIRFVNIVFQQRELPDASAIKAEELPIDCDLANGGYSLAGFRTHDTHHQNLWGHAELLPLIPRPADDASTSDSDLRDPLRTPRIVSENTLHEREGELIATKIRELLARAWRAGDEQRPLRYSDIMILLRSRTHAYAYEAALRRAGIPYGGAGRGNYLDCLEVQDFVHLLTVLISPHDNIALASTLRSPLFSVSDDDLIALASSDAARSWFDRLDRGIDLSPALARAASLLRRWAAAADRVPIHDLLDRIYDDGNVVARYAAAVAPHLKARVRANLDRLLALGLEVDGGRYPSLTHFLARLPALTRETTESDTGSQDADSVRMLTIHGAKGLEAPVVFLVNAAATDRQDRGTRALIEWPAEHERPRVFHLIGNKDEIDNHSRAALVRADAARQREEANLLYVALTRAKQVLYVSGCEPAKKNYDRGWYGFIERRLIAAGDHGIAAHAGLALTRIANAANGDTFNVTGTISHEAPRAVASTPAATNDVAVDPVLTRPFTVTAATNTTRPSRATSRVTESQTIDVRAARRGVLVHRLLELLTAPTPDQSRADIRARVRREFVDIDTTGFARSWDEAIAVIDEPALRHYYDAACFVDARNELSILYRRNGASVDGVVDRVVRYPNEIVLLDYKTHTTGLETDIELAAAHAPQLRLYACGIRALWPRYTIRALLLFTASRRVVPVVLD